MSQNPATMQETPKIEQALWEAQADMQGHNQDLPAPWQTPHQDLRRHQRLGRRASRKGGC